MRKKNKKPLSRKIVLRLPDLDHAKNSVLNSLSSPNSRRTYRFAMEQFITWYCSEPRLALNRTVVLRFRLHLESLGLAAGTINQRLAAVRRAAGGSLMITPDICIPAMHTMKEKYGDTIWGKYGFADAFNPLTGRLSTNTLSLDVGMTLLSAENLRSGSVWKWFMTIRNRRRLCILQGLISSALLISSLCKNANACFEGDRFWKRAKP
jgi:hypothetical protein